jgi:hypothetical protein
VTDGISKPQMSARSLVKSETMSASKCIGEIKNKDVSSVHLSFPHYLYVVMFFPYFLLQEIWFSFLMEIAAIFEFHTLRMFTSFIPLKCLYYNIILTKNTADAVFHYDYKD